jgi:UDP-glucose 4-epimerase
MEYESKHVVVTGGAGFIGSHFARELLNRGARVSTIDDYSAGRPELIPEGVDAYECDIRDERFGSLVQELDPDIVVHLAAIHYVPYCDANPEETFNANVMGTRNLLEALRECRSVEHVVFGSSAAVYPPRDGANAEDSPVGPMDIYGRSKLLGEDLVRLYHEETGRAATSARLFNVYGPDETNDHLIPAIIEQVREGATKIQLGNLTPARDFTYVEDVATALADIAAAAGDGALTYNIGSGREYTVREVAEKIGDVQGIDLTVEQDPERVRESDRPHLKADISRIKRDLGWEPSTGFTEGLRKLLDDEAVSE